MTRNVDCEVFSPLYLGRLVLHKLKFRDTIAMLH